MRLNFIEFVNSDNEVTASNMETMIASSEDDEGDLGNISDDNEAAKEAATGPKVITGLKNAAVIELVRWSMLCALLNVQTQTVTDFGYPSQWSDHL